LKETKTTKSGSDCPTLLHYLARVLLRTNPNLVNFMEDLPHVEAAARGECFRVYQSAFSHSDVVSLQTVATSVNALVSGLTQVKGEIVKLKGIRLSPEDQFVKVMEV
jgi:diaphanous 1